MPGHQLELRQGALERDRAPARQLGHGLEQVRHARVVGRDLGLGLQGHDLVRQRVVRCVQAWRMLVDGLHGSVHPSMRASPGR